VTEMRRSRTGRLNVSKGPIVLCVVIAG